MSHPSDDSSELSAIILAAGRGERMKSPLPKVLHPVAGQPMIERVVRAVKIWGAKGIHVVVSQGDELIQKLLAPYGVFFAVQREPLGTGDAVKSVKFSALADVVLIMNGDHPLVSGRQLQKAYRHFKETRSDLCIVTAKLDSPGSYGRIVRRGDQVQAIVEVKEASPEILKIQEINTGIYFVKKSLLEKYMCRISQAKSASGGVQKEVYLTDFVALCVEGGEKVISFLGEPSMSFGVNHQKDLSLATKALFRQKALSLMDQGVILIDPENTYIEESVRVGPGSVIYPGSFLKGETRLGNFCVVEPHVFIQDSQLGQSVQVRAGSYLEKAEVADYCILGPYARLREKTQLDTHVRIGNFVELKKARLGEGTKASHLSYLGDAEIGKNTNIGCGVITCNYGADKKKNVTKIGDDVFLGSDSQLIAPVEIGQGSVVASGSTVNKNVPPGALAIGRVRQENKLEYGKKFKKRN